MAHAAKPLPPTTVVAVPLPAPPAAEGPRKLIRPRLPNGEGSIPLAPRRLRGPAPLFAQELPHPHHAAESHAESLYLHKQAQAQTPMVFVLEDGEQIQGTIEWFDRDSIKVRNTARLLIFKRAIKYLHKASEA